MTVIERNLAVSVYKHQAFKPLLYNCFTYTTSIKPTCTAYDCKCYHSIEQVQGPEPNGLVFIVETLQNEILVRLHRLWVSFQDLGHGQQT